MMIQKVLENQRIFHRIEMPFTGESVLPSFMPPSWLIKYLSRKTGGCSMPEMLCSSVCIPAILASGGSNLWVKRETLPQMQRCHSCLFAGPSWFQHAL